MSTKIENELPANDDNKASDINSLEVIKSFLNQFSANQNHNQTLFIQFLSSVIIVLIGYAFVYSNTSGFSTFNSENKTPPLSKPIYSNSDSAFIIPPLEARPFESIKSKTGSILSYGLIHLAIIYLFSQMVLIILGLLILHIGYSFRRDQVVVNKMRQKYLGEEDYKIYFSNYSGLNKKVYNYLPNFNSILFYGIFFIQVLIYISIFIFFSQFDPAKHFIKYFFFEDINYFQAKIILVFPLGVSSFFYCLYYVKYNKKVNNLDHYRHISITKINNKQILNWMGTFNLILAIIKFLIWLDTGSYGILATCILSTGNAIAFFISAYLQIRITKNSKTNFSFLFKLTIHGIIFFIGSILIFILFFFYNKIDVSHLLSLKLNLLILLIVIFLITTLSYSIKRNLILSKTNDEFKLIIRKQLGIDGYLLTIIVLFLEISNYTGILWFDKYLSLFIGILALIWGFRRLSNAMDITLSRKGISKTIQ